MSSEQAKEYEKQMHLSAIIAINENGELRDGENGIWGVESHLKISGLWD